MVVILRFVNNDGILSFFVVKSVSDTTLENLKNEISYILVHYDLQGQNLRGQGYNGANVIVFWGILSSFG